jgi:hypothetical protein
MQTPNFDLNFVIEVSTHTLLYKHFVIKEKHISLIYMGSTSNSRSSSFHLGFNIGPGFKGVLGIGSIVGGIGSTVGGIGSKVGG